MDDNWLMFWAGTAAGAGVIATTAALWRRRVRARQARALARTGAEVERLSGTLEGIPDGLYRFDAETGAESCSARLAVLLSLKEGTAATFDQVLTRFEPVDAETLYRAVNFLRGEGRGFDLCLHDVDRLRLLQVRGVRVVTAGGRPRADLVWMRDVTDIGAARAPDTPKPAPAPPPSPAPVRDRAGGVEAAVLENLTTAIAVFGPDRRLRYRNGAFDRLWGLGAEWLGGGPSYGEVLTRLRERRRLPEVADFRAFKEAEIALFAEIAAPREDLLHLPDGATVRRLTSPHPQGGLIFAYEDVTERLELESSYQILSAVQRETLDNLSEGIAVFGSDGRLQLCNPAFIALWDLGGEALGEQPHLSRLIDMTRRFHPLSDADWPEFRDRMTRRFLSREAASGTIARTDDSVLEYASVPLPDGGVLLSHLDVTDGARVEHALRERAEAMAEADRMKSEFLANLSHEMRTPLNSVLGFAEMLARELFGKLNPRQMDYTRGILDSARGLLALLNDTIDLASIQTGQMSLEIDTIDVHALLAGVLTLTREQVARKKLDLHFDCPADAGWIVGDERRLKQVAFHLLSNAVKLTPAGGAVTLSAKRDGEWMAITVTDSGIGLSEREQARLMGGEAATDADAAEAEAGGGMGLTLVRRFVEMHGGAVAVTARRGRGTSVTCRLPAI